ncbi:phosphatidate cytidylyltransferase [Zymobacter sp. IVIA_5232.4 C2]|uniref:phosphatidate cytidylyltransferase n=1 Tax=Zymobacter sp. IVIA_5232.4 C2 TaxID=3394855 RepID=UPI0039C38D9B
MLGIPPHVQWVVGCVVVLLAVASVISIAMVKLQPQHDHTELRQRIRSWWWMIALLFMALLFNRTVAIVFFAVLSYLALKEFFSIVPTRLMDRRVLFWAYLAIPVQYLWVGMGWLAMISIFIPVYVFLFLPVRMLLIGETRGFIRSAGVIHWMVMLAVYCLSHLGALLMLPATNAQAGYVGPVLFVLLMTQLNDVAQYIWGKSLGRHKIVPKVSPGKTWEGMVGGCITIVIVSALLGPWLTGLSAAMSALAGGLMAVCGFFGDVVISSVKRDLQIKDTGRLIPGHGGLLDRLDSLIYTAPIFFHFYHYLGGGMA